MSILNPVITFACSAVCSTNLGEAYSLGHDRKMGPGICPVVNLDGGEGGEVSSRSVTTFACSSDCSTDLGEAYLLGRDRKMGPCFSPEVDLDGDEGGEVSSLSSDHCTRTASQEVLLSLVSFLAARVRGWAWAGCRGLE